MKKPTQIIHEAQQVLARYLPPDGISADQAISELLRILDGQDAVLMTTAYREGLPPPVNVAGSANADAREAVVAVPPALASLRGENLRLNQQIQAYEKTVGWLNQENEKLTNRCKLAESALQSTGWQRCEGPAAWTPPVAAGVSLPSASDAHEAVATMAAKVARLEDELNRTRAHETHLIQQRDRLIHEDLKQAHEKIVELQGQLTDTQERERRLSERLASIASITSDM